LEPDDNRRLTRTQVVSLVEVIYENDRKGIGSDSDIELLRTGIPCPYIIDIIYYPHRYAPGRDMLTAEEVAEIAMRYRPFSL
jgi:hypothetical protein